MAVLGRFRAVHSSGTYCCTCEQTMANCSCECPPECDCSTCSGTTFTSFTAILPATGTILTDVSVCMDICIPIDYSDSLYVVVEDSVGNDICSWGVTYTPSATEVQCVHFADTCSVDSCFIGCDTPVYVTVRDSMDQRPAEITWCGKYTKTDRSCSCTDCTCSGENLASDIYSSSISGGVELGGASVALGCDKITSVDVAGKICFIKSDGSSGVDISIRARSTGATLASTYVAAPGSLPYCASFSVSADAADCANLCPGEDVYVFFESYDACPILSICDTTSITTESLCSDCGCADYNAVSSTQISTISPPDSNSRLTTVSYCYQICVIDGPDPLTGDFTINLKNASGTVLATDTQTVSGAGCYTLTAIASGITEAQVACGASVTVEVITPVGANGNVCGNYRLNCNGYSSTWDPCPCECTEGEPASLSLNYNISISTMTSGNYSYSVTATLSAIPPNVWYVASATVDYTDDFGSSSSTTSITLTRACLDDDRVGWNVSFGSLPLAGSYPVSQDYYGVGAGNYVPDTVDSFSQTCYLDYRSEIRTFAASASCDTFSSTFYQNVKLYDSEPAGCSVMFDESTTNETVSIS